MARVGLEPGTARLRVRGPDRLAMLPPPSQENSNRNTGLVILVMFAFPKKVMEKDVNGSYLTSIVINFLAATEEFCVLLKTTASKG